MSSQATPEELARFMSYVDKLPNGCWYWTGARSRGKGNKKWYGTFWFRGKSIRAHRFSADHIGEYKPLPPGHDRSHTCDFSMCVCPEHVVHEPKVVNHERKLARSKAQKALSEGMQRVVQAELCALANAPYEAPHMTASWGR